jgi:quinol monooxygenase YgiN
MNALNRESDEDKQPGTRTETVIELRRYRLYPEKREELISLFDREFIETQEETGMCVVGQFRDIDNPDAFVWLRKFKGMEARAAALEAFYSGPAWQSYGPQANATMRNSDNVLLLRPWQTEESLPRLQRRPVPGTVVVFGSLFICSICYLKPSGEKAFGDFFEQKVKPEILNAGAEIVGVLASAHTRNTWPRLPVREGENVFIWLSRFSHVGDYSIYTGRLEQSDMWRNAIASELDAFLWKPIEISRLTPTARSGLR